MHTTNEISEGDLLRGDFDFSALEDMDPSLAGGDFKTLPSMKSKSFVFIQMVLPCYT